MDLNTVYFDEMLMSRTSSSLPRPKTTPLLDHTVTNTKPGSKDNAKENNNPIKPVQKKDKHKRKDKKRNLTSSDITLPTEVTQMPKIETVDRTLVNHATKQGKKDVENGNADVNKRMKELRAEKADIKTHLLTLKYVIRANP